MSMSGHRNKGHLNSKSGKEIFLTSSSLSFSSLSSSGASWDDAVERHTKESTTSCEEPKEVLSKASSQGSEMQGTANNVSTQPGPSPPLRLRPVQLRNNGYDPNRIPASVFGKNKEVNWSEVSNDSLFSLKMDGYRMSHSQGYRQSNLKPEEALKSGEFLAYSPFISIKLEEAEEKISEVEETKIEGTGGVISSVETRKRQEKPSSSAPPIILWTATPSDYCTWDQARPEKRKKPKKSKKKKEKKKNKCCIWSWLCSRFSKCEVNMCCCYKWRKCCCCFKGTK